MTALPESDDLVATFQIENQPSRGRVVRLGAVVHEILTRHAYPELAAELLGEACVLAALVGSSLKFNGRLIVQAQGDGPVRYVVADYATDGGLRGYCRFDEAALLKAGDGFVRPGARSLLGEGLFRMTIDPEDGRDRYQGVVAIEGETLALCAEQYFAQSEQTPTRVRLAVAQTETVEGRRWRAGGMLVQNIAADAARGETEEAWTRVEALFATLGEDELVDPLATPEVLLYRLFHEDGVRVFPAHPLRAFCRCSEARVRDMLRTFPEAERDDMAEEDGQIRVTCEYCSTTYALEPASVAVA